MSEESKTLSVVPSDLKRAELFDKAGALFLQNTFIGFSTGYLASLVIFSKPCEN